MAKRADSPPPGKTTIAPEVLLNLVRLTTLSVEGVSRMSHVPSAFKQWTQPRRVVEGVEVDIEGNQVGVDIFVVLKKDVNLRLVGGEIQNKVARALYEMAGMEATRLDIHIEDIDYPLAA